MPGKQASLFPLLSAAALCLSCSSDIAPLSSEQFESENLEWRAERLENLRGPHGYLNLAGLFWLEPGATSIGSAADNDIVFPTKADAHIGVLQVSSDGVLLEVAPGVEVLADGQAVTQVSLDADTTGAPVSVSHKSFAWIIIERDNRFALRLRDFEHPAIMAFPPLEYFPLDPELRVAARYNEYAAPKIVNVDTVIEGLGWQPQSPGYVEFDIGGESMQLEAYDAGDELFFVFGDQSSGRDTYPAGRFLYADRVADGATTWLDFNRAYNPPCAFNDFATCPVASPQNRLPIKIAAGEKFDPKVHATPNSQH